jgi:hypothetical protein
VEAAFTREPSMFGPSFHCVRLYFRNTVDADLGPVALGKVVRAPRCVSVCLCHRWLFTCGRAYSGRAACC